jgi:Putative transposase
MPDVLWPLFQDNPHLTEALSALAARVIQIRLNIRSGLRVGIMAILHTFNGKLEFNSHVHTMVTAGGLYGSSDTWIHTVYYRRDGLLQSWRKAVIRLLRAALRAGRLVSALTVDEVEAILNEQEKRWWSVKVQNFKSKEHFLKYAGRYLRRPPIAQRRVTHVGERVVGFWYKDKKLRRKVYVQCSPEEFIERWSQHIPERYRHAVRNFGLFGPRAVRQTFDAVFALMGQKRSPRPKPRPYAESIKRDFGWDPLLDSHGKRMVWVGRIAPRPSLQS